MTFLIKYFLILCSAFLFSTSVLSQEYLKDTNDIERLKLWEEIRDSILPDAPIEQSFDYVCLYLSINPDNLDVYKGGFVRFGKVNKKKIFDFFYLQQNQQFLQSKMHKHLRRMTIK